MKRARVGVAALLVAAGLDAGAAAAPAGPESAVEALLGRHGRETFHRQLATRRYGGKPVDVATFERWGRALVVRGFVPDPPVGRAPSPRLSKHYRCVHCHNLAPEDATPATPDPIAREALVPAPARPGEPVDGSTLGLRPATTFHGIVNRESFYNGLFAKYRSLKVASGDPMNPERLADAIQVCSRYCSAGRFPEAWELDAILAYFWSLELRLKDLGLGPEAEARVIAAAGGTDAAALAETRALLRRSYRPAAAATPAEPPADTYGDADVYRNGRRETGDAGRGRLVFEASCGGCHGRDVDAPSVAKLSRRARGGDFLPRVVRRGSERWGGVYMPPFSAERLSPRQLADARAYLRSLAR